jgi:hypothetical protein
MKDRIQSSFRLRAFLTHLLISGGVGIAVALFVSQVWYPHTLMALMGGFGIFLILVAVDVILGPAITLVIARPGKSRRALVFDYSVIGLVQIMALAYGLHTLALGRPAIVVFAKDGFIVMRANEFEEADLADAKDPKYKSLSMTRPIWLSAKMPTNIAERNKIVLDAATGGKDFYAYPKYYQSLDHQEVSRMAVPLAELRKRLPAGTQLNAEYLDGYQPRDEADIGFVPLVGKTQSICALIQRSDGKLVGYAWHSPW